MIIFLIKLINHEKNKKISIVGLGSMGMSISKVLIDSGWEVFGVDLNSDIVNKFKSYGGHPLENTSKALEFSNLIILMVVNEKQCDDVLFGSNGGYEKFCKGKIVINCSTVSSEYAKKTASHLTKFETGYLDAPVSGGKKGAINGSLSIMISGSKKFFETSKSVLEVISSKIYYLGQEIGLGSSMKMINQLLVGIHIVSAAEAISLAKKVGLDTQIVYEVIRHSAGNSWAFEDRVPRMHDSMKEITSTIDIFLKDLTIVLKSAEALNMELPLSEAALKQYIISYESGKGMKMILLFIKIILILSLVLIFFLY